MYILGGCVFGTLTCNWHRNKKAEKMAKEMNLLFVQRGRSFYNMDVPDFQGGSQITESDLNLRK